MFLTKQRASNWVAAYLIISIPTVAMMFLVFKIEVTEGVLSYILVSSVSAAIGYLLKGDCCREGENRG